jgi:hypothetical protein
MQHLQVPCFGGSSSEYITGADPMSGSWKRNLMLDQMLYLCTSPPPYGLLISYTYTAGTVVIAAHLFQPVVDQVSLPALSTAVQSA